jgi:hypothetical protein
MKTLISRYRTAEAEDKEAMLDLLRAGSIAATAFGLAGCALVGQIIALFF